MLSNPENRNYDNNKKITTKKITIMPNSHSKSTFSLSTRYYVTFAFVLISIFIVMSSSGGLLSNSNKNKNESPKPRNGDNKNIVENPTLESAVTTTSSPENKNVGNNHNNNIIDSSPASATTTIKYIYFDDDDFVKFDDEARSEIPPSAHAQGNAIVDEAEPIFDFDYYYYYYASPSSKNQKKDNNKTSRGGGGKWVVVDRKRALQWFQSNFGLMTNLQEEEGGGANKKRFPTYSCGIAAVTANNYKNGNKILDSFDYSADDQIVFSSSEATTTSSSSSSIENDRHAAKMKFMVLEKEFDDQATLSLSKNNKLTTRNHKSTVSWKSPIPMITWYDSTNEILKSTATATDDDIDRTMFLKMCSPRLLAGKKNKALYSVSSSSFQNSFRIRSFSEPSIGLGCLRKLLILDGHSSSFSQAMIKRCVPLNNINHNNNNNMLQHGTKNYIKKRKQKLKKQQQPFVVAMGHSHTRYLSAMLCMLANNSWCSDFNGIKNGRAPFYPGEMFDSLFARPDKVSVIESQDDDTTIVSNPKDNNETSDISSTSSSLWATPSFIQQLQIFSPNTVSSIEKKINQLKLQPLPMVYAANYYDHRISLIKLLTWMNAKGKVLSAPPSSFSSSAKKGGLRFLTDRHNKLLKQKTEREMSDFSGSNLGIKLLKKEKEKNRNENIDDDDDNDDLREDERNNNFDQEIIDWIQKELYDENDNDVNKEKGKHFKFPLPKPTHFIVSRGEWDLLYLNPNPKALVIQIQRSLHVLSKSFPDAKIIFQLPQKHYGSSLLRKPAGPREKQMNKMAQWRNNCGSDTRMLMLRDACICASYRFTKKKTKNSSTDTDGDAKLFDKNKNNLILFDTNSLTKTEFGFTFVDALGHHYIDAALEVMAQEIRRIIEREHVAQSYVTKTMEFLKMMGKESCRRIDDIESAKTFSAAESGGEGNTNASANNKNSEERKCSCHRNEPEDSRFCKGSKMLPRSVG